MTGGEGGVPEWSIGSPSSKGPSMLGLFGGVTSPIFTNDFRLCPADARENTLLLPVKLVMVPELAVSGGDSQWKGRPFGWRDQQSYRPRAWHKSAHGGTVPCKRHGTLRRQHLARSGASGSGRGCAAGPSSGPSKAQVVAVFSLGIARAQRHPVMRCSTIADWGLARTGLQDE